MRVFTLALAFVLMLPGSAWAADFIYATMGGVVIRYDISLGTSAAVAASQQIFASPIPASSPYGLAFAGDTLYTANFGSNTITRYDSSGTYLGPPHFVPSGQGLNYPIGLAFDTSGNIYAANNGSNTITRYNSQGFRIGTNFIDQGLSNPVGITFDTVGNLYVANGNNTITRYNSAGIYSGTPFVNTGQGLNSPTGLAFDTSGNLYVANSGNNTITRYDSSGTYLGGTPFIPSGQGLNNPYGLAFDTSGNLYVANNSSTGTISKYNSDGVFQFSWSTPLPPRFLAFPIVVPEPSTYILGTIAALTMAILAQRKRRTAMA